ncbi:cytidine deaminase [soil metagenome]
MTEGIDWDTLTARAWQAKQNAYAPYSEFGVGAALLARSGEIHSGCNVENASFGLTICAERAALFAAIAAGNRDFVALAIAAETEQPISPCGACRQVLAEFGLELEISSSGRDGVRSRYSLAELLPSPFGKLRG